MGAPKRSPRPRGSEQPTLEHLFALEHSKPPPAFSQPVDGDELLAMISNCTLAVFTFTDPSESPSLRDLKRHKLARILSSLRSSAAAAADDDRLLSSLFAMLVANLFRPLPPPPHHHPNASDFAADEDPPATMSLAPSWPHLSIVYDVLAVVLSTADADLLRRHVDSAFLLNLLALFQSEDPRELDRLKNAYHTAYARLTAERSFMRRSMGDVLLRFAFEAAEQRHSGIGELLEIWGSIINGFSVPLKEEHRRFLARVLMPLHRPKGMHAYHKQLAYCVTQFVRKDPELAGAVARAILRRWPLTNCNKELLLIGELEDLLDCAPAEQLAELAVPLCTQIARCLNSSNSQVAERALCVWNNELFVKMASEFMEDVLPATVEGIEKNIKWHWNKSVQQLTVSVKQMLEEMEPELYSKCLCELNRRESMAGQEELKRKKRWERLEMAAANNHLIQQSNCISMSHQLKNTSHCSSS